MADLDEDYLVGKIKSVADKGYAVWDPKLKRVPPSFGKDHAHCGLSRQKGLVATGHPIPSAAPSRDLASKLDAAFADVWPLSDMLIGVAETPTL
ncbi:hypothetical protein OAN307_c15570 [Octadecabacter antarcticus 307]|uniref:Uncharacterized protein n=1 Tax=Octadecabacter antarcticus 307 TaxID=391626 RepID=M9RBM4_9RHOB|nr:hypothetical protein [Octadecabacter antarcticus]AGI67230.1 hypothetical protein OAN307_c15570 [Octadecabacter antarcticus 307]